MLVDFIYFFSSSVLASVRLLLLIIREKMRFLVFFSVSVFRIRFFSIQFSFSFACLLIQVTISVSSFTFFFISFHFCSLRSLFTYSNPHNNDDDDDDGIQSFVLSDNTMFRFSYTNKIKNKGINLNFLLFLLV